MPLNFRCPLCLAWEDSLQQHRCLVEHPPEDWAQGKAPKVLPRMQEMLHRPDRSQAWERLESSLKGWAQYRQTQKS